MATIARRRLLASLAGAAAWPIAARGQQAERMRRIGALMTLAADDSQAQVRLAAFQQALQQLGWSDGRNVRIRSAGTRTMPTGRADTRRN
jgi:putative ABC transport system substrate-binding protein